MWLIFREFLTLFSRLIPAACSQMLLSFQRGRLVLISTFILIFQDSTGVALHGSQFKSNHCLPVSQFISSSSSWQTISHSLPLGQLSSHWLCLANRRFEELQNEGGVQKKTQSETKRLQLPEAWSHFFKLSPCLMCTSIFLTVQVSL